MMFIQNEEFEENERMKKSLFCFVCSASECERSKTKSKANDVLVSSSTVDLRTYYTITSMYKLPSTHELVSDYSVIARQIYYVPVRTGTGMN